MSEDPKKDDVEETTAGKTPEEISEETVAETTTEAAEDPGLVVPEGDEDKVVPEKPSEPADQQGRADEAWIKLLESAVANAEHNHELVGEDLRILSVDADEGPTLKRFRPRAMGRATRIRKRTSHLTIPLTPKES